MQSHYPASFERDMACTEAEWLAWLPKAMGEHDWQRSGQTVRVQLQGGGQLDIEWKPLPPRTIALMCLPRMCMAFRFDGADDQARMQFMRRFDLTTQRGGG
jgi:hypothetical protein